MTTFIYIAILAAYCVISLSVGQVVGLAIGYAKWEPVSKMERIILNTSAVITFIAYIAMSSALAVPVLNAVNQYTQ